MPRQMVCLPEPQVLRRRSFTSRKINKVEKSNKSPYLMVPRFFDMYHPTTVWLINTIVSQNEKELDRVLSDKGTNGLLKFEPDPAAIQQQRTVMRGSKNFIITKAKYFQILDRPEMYDPSSANPPLFGRHAVLYLTPLGLAIYLHKIKAAKQLLECINRDTNKKHVLARQPQFITCLNDRFGDLMCMYDHNLAMLNEENEILHLMIANNNWFPMEPFKLVYRKRFIETNLSFDDFLDYAFYLIFTKRSSFNVARLCTAVIKRPSEHFNFNYMNQPTRAMKITLIRDAEKVINNCKTYPRRLLRCAFYADKKLKSTLNLLRAAECFIMGGIFKLTGDPVLPFNPKEGRRKRLEALQPFKPRSREPHVDWPQSMYEFDCDCCIALLCGLMSKCHRMGKKAPFQMAMTLAGRALGDGGWLDYFARISDLEFKDYFMGLDDAEKLRFRPEIFSYVREYVKITVYENRFNLAEYFSDSRLNDEIKEPTDVKNNNVLSRLVQCSDEKVAIYVNLPKGEKLKPVATVIGGPRVRGEGRDDPKNKYYMDRMEFPPESVKTVMINTANVAAEGSYDSQSSNEATEINCSNCSTSQRVHDGQDDEVAVDLREIVNFHHFETGEAAADEAADDADADADDTTASASYLTVTPDFSEVELEAVPEEPEMSGAGGKVITKVAAMASQMRDNPGGINLMTRRRQMISMASNSKWRLANRLRKA